MRAHEAPCWPSRAKLTRAQRKTQSTTSRAPRNAGWAPSCEVSDAPCDVRNPAAGERWDCALNEFAAAPGWLGWPRRRGRCSSAQARVDRNGSHRAREAQRPHGRPHRSLHRPDGALLTVSQRAHRHPMPVSMPSRRTRPRRAHVLPCARPRRPVRRRMPPLWLLASALPEQLHPLRRLDVGLRL